MCHQERSPTSSAAPLPIWVVFFVLYCFGFLVRLLYLSHIADLPLFNAPIMDEKYHLELTRQILGETPSPPEPYFRGPLYPHFLAGLSVLADNSLWWIRVLQLMITSLLSPVLFLTARRILPFWWSVGTGLAAALYPTFWYFESSLLIESVMPLLATLLVLLLYRAIAEPTRSRLIWVGVALGLLALLRVNALLIVPAALWVLWVSWPPHIAWRKKLGRVVMIGLAIAITILPVTLRNYFVGDDAVLIAWQGGLNFYIGNHRASDGWSATIPGVDATWEGGYRESILIAEEARGRTLRRSEVSDFWYDAALTEIRADVGGWFGRLFHKTDLLLNGYEIPNNQSDYLNRHVSWLHRWFVADGFLYVPYGILLPFALLGLLLSLARWRDFLPIYAFLIPYAGSLVLFFVCGRFRQPLIPCLIVLALHAVYQSIIYVERKNVKMLALCGVLLALFFPLSNRNLLDLSRSKVMAEELSTIGTAHLNRNELPEAEEWFRKAIEADSSHAPPLSNLGIIAHRRGQHRIAVTHFNRAIELNPNLFEPYVNSATASLEMGAAEDAIEVLQLAAERFPRSDYVNFRLGMTLFETGRFYEGIRGVERALSLNPTNAAARDALNQMRDYVRSLPPDSAPEHDVAGKQQIPR